MKERIRIGSIGQVSLSVTDLDAAIEFYGEKVGLRFIGRFAPGLAFFDCVGGLGGRD